MLEIQHLTKKYRKLLANDDLSFRVQDGEVAVLAGPNGAGKSTAIKCIAGLLRFQGSVTVCGHPNKSVEAKRLFGYIPEIPAPMESLTVREHLEFIARAYRVEDWQKKADVLLERLELEDKQKKLGGELSKGMQQKLSICCALLPEPKAVLLDEPLVGLDPHAIKELREMMEELRARGCSVLVSTHMLDTVRQVWDRALIMMNGKIAAERTRREMETGGESLEQLFFSITEGKGEELGSDSVHSA
ncbi:ABC-type transporter ATP-binding protein EcsA [Caprobacter fermentans]|uniref:ABC transporter ATP-binding protein n=1 Tax=Caproicibacter fermentans TaxID=2576756 RepID=A0A6N8I251_9FIRM|nr:ABC transporter ATP-binding protein [Caproicibacter fermentans]MVB12102.1 ABC-type transporter ATP-binding protein EcsA [Caproicibacter fermentans]OCN01244.1 ABC transporter ATP-binding protein [Clostridium sp. W14A]QNK39534.1 ABC transporter ATP-binding protein [Caproicibacter fermentans]